ncbi:conserved hypothetical protein [Neospora caninum Liverpool]|uniref:Mediator complex subunit MED4 n=1 Tax=Neospora caninum (strain Liverpool) TaxID=572307 RepID=F0VK59_NEOCL|nr:conserved hypothetical protein [Neospora caninum Liverpool]CBZ54460.1 conserved hypothetical protein [Neospora caninum Liverpool]CEL69172.1 TPA: mediator complex subunit MED4 [Neospora caninum Liverpool]|eukprot:XP_003884490.1 conserved hypothetical protein [Neospora caninum Liverpool]
MAPPASAPSTSSPASSPASSPSLQDVYALLRSVVKPEWRDIPDTASEEWKKRFRELVDAEKPVSSAPPGPADRPAAPSAPSVSSSLADGSFLRALPREFQLHLLVKISSVLETPWLVAQKRLEGIKEAEKARPLTLDEVVTYARRLGGSTAAPPETSNISDVVAHQSVYPAFHFLPYPSMEELQESRLGFLASKPFDRVCFPPEMRSKWTVRAPRRCRDETVDTLAQTGDETRPERLSTERKVAGYEVRLVCQTPGAQIVYCVFDGWMAPNALPPQTLWRETAYSPQEPLFLSAPFPKTLLARAMKPPLQPSRPALLRLNPRGVGSGGTRSAEQPPRRPDAAPSSAAAGPSSQAPGRTSEQGRGARAEWESRGRDAQAKRDRDGSARAGGDACEKPHGRSESELGREGGGSAVPRAGSGRETPQAAGKDRSATASGEALADAAGPDRTQPPTPAAPQASHPTKPPSPEGPSQGGAASDRAGGPDLSTGGGASGRAPQGSRDASMGGSATFQGLMLGSTRRKRREETLQRREVQESSGSADSSSSGEDSSDEEDERKGE